MDGNNRWSIKKKISKFEAYRLGSQNLLKITEFLFDNYDINFISAFALSSNNLKRDFKSINILKKVYNYFIDCLIQKKKINYTIEIIGDLSFLEKEVIEKTNLFLNNQKKLKNKLILFINYSGQNDIETTHKNIIKYKYYNNNISDFLSTKNIPNPDILFRSGGFKRLSNFMLYEIAFTELFFSNKLWPEIKNSDLKSIINNFYKIERKFGY